MRVAFSSQGRLDCSPVLNVELNINCRDEIIPILSALQHIYSQPEVRDAILALVAHDVNRDSSDERGREGMSYWQILVLASVRLGCNLNYDRLHDLAEQHRALRHIMGLGDWDRQDFSWQRIRDNVCLVRPETIEQINHLVVAAGHQLAPEAAASVRGDSFVVETNVHYPTESSLIGDGLRKLLELAPQLALEIGASGWRQHQSLLKKIKKQVRRINRIAAKKGKDYQVRLADAYRHLLRLARLVTARTQELLDAADSAGWGTSGCYLDLIYFLAATEHVCGTAQRRVLEDEQVPSDQKLLSLFEPYTQLIKRGKAGQPVQFGHSLLILEDGAGFVSHYRLLNRGEEERAIVVAELQTLQSRLEGRIRRASFDRGFHSPENQRDLAQVVTYPCLPMPGAQQAQQQQSEASVEFRQSRQRHPGVESAIGALQSGNGLKRCRDHTRTGFARYVGLGILGRNLHVLGKLVIARQDATCRAAISLRQPAAA